MMQLTIPAHAGRLAEVFAFIDESVMNTGMDVKTVNNVMLAVEEIFINIANYAYPSGNGDADITVSAAGDRLSIVFKDSGIPFDPLAGSDPDTELTAEEREIGGLGIFMVKKLMDDVEYRYENRQNILTVSKEF